MKVTNPATQQDGQHALLEDEVTSLRSRRRCHLVLVPNELTNQVGDFLRIAELVRQHDPKITTTVVTDRYRGMARMAARAMLPTLMLSFVPLARFRPLRGRFLQGVDLSKSQEYTQLERTGFAIPKWQIIEEGQTPDPAEYGTYLVTKPDRGMRGALVKIKRTKRVGAKAKSNATYSGQGRYAPGIEQKGTMLAQRFIYTGEWPQCYRVATLFGQVLYSFKVEASHDRTQLPGPEAFGNLEGERGVSIVASGRGCRITMNPDEEIIRFAEAAHSAFPDIPLLGFDVVREVPSGKLYILEANAVGYVWHFSSPMGTSIQQENEICFEDQFNGIHKAALILAENTQELAQ